MSRSVTFDFRPRSRQALGLLARGMAMAGMIAAMAFASPAQANPKYAGIVVDAKTGKVLYNENADELRFPASLTKMMTLYLTFEALESGKIRKNSPVPVSKNAAMEPPSKLGVRAGGTLTVEQAIQALVTRSANDVATALAEFLGGSEDRFARMMTQKARALGMTRTVYRNAHGLPNSAQVTTARDQARLGMALRQHFPQHYTYFSTRSFTYNKQVIGNHNRLLGAVRGVDGIKTGYTRASGYNLVTSAETDGRSIVGVVMGGRSGASRNEQMKSLVARYMPAASQGRGSNQIARTAPAPTLTTEAAGGAVSASAASGGFELPVNGPVPAYRYEESRIETAYAATAGTQKLVGKDALAATLKMSNVAIPEPAPAYVPEQGDGGGDLDKLTTASVPSGWVIQIGATPDKSQAEMLLEQARQKGGKALDSTTPFTVAFANGNEQLFRARFGGFSSQNRAAAACKVLKQKGFGCWASLQ